MQNRILALLVGLVVLYAILGGVIFHFLESSEETKTRENTLQYQSRFLVNNPCISEEELRLLIGVIIKAYSQGIIASNTSDDEPNWDIANSIFFSSTVITTIGYGNLAPATQAGQAVCVLYAMFGIPLTLVMLSGVGERLINLYDRIASKFCKSKPSRLGKLIRFINIFALGCIFLVFIPSGIFCALEEDWTYGTSLYYSMVTLSTIGFGDYVIGNHFTGRLTRTIYRLSVTVWIILGLSWFATCISAAQDFLQQRVEHIGDQAEEKEECKGEKDSIRDDAEDVKVTEM